MLAPRRQVLNAWRRHWNRHRMACLASSGTRAGAQRLAASLESAPSGSGVIGCVERYVLNAWRRHWNRHSRRRDLDVSAASMCSTPGGVIGIGTIRQCRLARNLAECSTPGGVIGIGTRCDSPGLGSRYVLNAWRRHWNRHQHPLRLLGPCCRVLNAWRRHWNRHVVLPVYSASDRMCSTPGGVIGIGT